MSKLIYTQDTLNILAQKNLEQTKLLVSTGVIKELALESGAQGVKYLVIE